MKTSKMGRPRLAAKEKRDSFISTRLSSVEMNEIARAIRQSGEAKTEWVRKCLLAAARELSA